MWAHYGGGFDYRFALPWLLKRSRRARFVTVGSIVLQSVGETRDGERYDLRDSIRLLPGTLAKIGESMDLPKLGQDMDHTSAPGCRCVGCESRSKAGRARLLAYCERDCEILWQALAKAEIALAKVGVIGLRTTLASCSSFAVRSRLAPDERAYTPHGEKRGVPDIDANAERANYGGDVQPYRERLAPGALGRIYDVRSMYPWAMSSALPWRYKGPTRDVPANGYVVADVEVPADCYVPALPWRCERGPDRGRVYFPTGRWRGAWVGEELRAAVESGAARVLKVVEAHEWETSDALAWFVDLAWRERQGAVGFDRYFWKIALNSLYGKTVEGREKEMVLLDDGRSMAGFTRIARGLPLKARPVYYQPRFRNVITGATVTARARVRLRALKLEVLRQGGALYYCDTDSIACSGAILPTGAELGDLDEQARFVAAHFVAPKLYWYEREDGTCVVRAKGLPRMDRETLERAVSPDPDNPRRGAAVTFARSEGIRESLRKGRTIYRRVEVTRSRHLDRRGKRCALPDGDTRPWSMEELRG